jgi:hypothetical protein
MSRKIAVFGSDQEFGEARTFVKKSVAQLRVNRLLADWIEEGYSIRMREGDGLKAPAQPAKDVVYERGGKIDPAEIEGLKFADPDKGTMAIRRRKVAVANGIMRPPLPLARDRALHPILGEV